MTILREDYFTKKGMKVFWYTGIFLLLFSGAVQTQRRTVFNFESASHLTAFSVPPTSTLQLSMTHYKDASHSMKWTWSSGDAITHSFASSEEIRGTELTRGGIKLWIYNTHRLTGHLTVSFEDTRTTPRAPVIISRFPIHLDFKGWRGIWVTYGESRYRWGRIINLMKITAPTTDAPTHPLYFDQIRFVDSMGYQSRDKVVPTIHAGRYTTGSFWQQSYRWSQVTPPAVSGDVPNPAKLEDLSLIEKRLDNWFVRQDQSSASFDGNAFRRWTELQRQIVKANRYLDDLNIHKSDAGVITGVPLYARNSEFGNKKFSFVMQYVLLPLALEYHIKSRTIDVDAVAAEELTNLNSNNTATKRGAIRRITGGDTGIRAVFTNALGTSTPYTEENVKEAINTLNNKRKDRLILILEYVNDQGFADGSAIGSLDHEMNRDGAGFMNSVYLLRTVLQEAGKLSDILATMKWYNDFNEIYQQHFEYSGTSADRMRTISLFRLFIVLMSPSATTQQKQEKLRDMDALVRWYANALSPNEGLSGVLKPDHLAFHHGGYYANAYTPNALHKAALIKYLLSGTAFALGPETCEHLEKGLQTMRIVALKYSFPNSVSGRFPGFTRASISRMFPAFAYIGANAPNLEEDGSLGEIDNVDANKIRMFLRLYNPTDRSVNTYLGKGQVSSSIFYLNTIGSIGILEAINREALRMSVSAEPSPKGFWAKNYASLVIQRRADWAVSVKGFNRHVWDFEASYKGMKTRNMYGLYQSHGALLIANSEEALKSHDIDKGWDWTRHPGTTTIKMDLEQLVSETRRYFQPRRLAGGLVMIGGGAYPNGIFGMEFSQPRYKYPPSSFQLSIDFRFRKSVFFADHCIVCLGSGISTNHVRSNITQTTLFQNKLVDPESPSSIHINSTSYSLSTDQMKQPSFFGPGDNSVTLMDTNGNGYYIPDAAEQGLNVQVSLQFSKKHNRRGVVTEGRYATAWLDHGVHPRNKGYEYAILVNRPLRAIQNLAARQASTNNKAYEVLMKDSKAHVVKVNDFPRPGQAQYGYVIFRRTARTPGPVERFSKGQCIVMVEQVDSSNMYIAVSSPNLNFNISRTLDMAGQVSGDERFYSISQEIEVKVYLREAVNTAIGDVIHDGKVVPTVDKAAHVEVKPRMEGDSLGSEIIFKKLAKGFTTEVKLTR